MSTECSSCGKELIEQLGENFLHCNICNRMTPKGAHSFLKKEVKGGVKKMVEKTTKFGDIDIKVKELITAGKSATEIKTELGDACGGLPRIRRMIKKFK